ncbi:MAG: 4'-phosphopantetheinyl transferase superfamily protein [Bacteroidales bacterium]|nr:4'-phosphopantetheinyl transferase superfamily protein [Bacteroidales bacterium]
MIKIFDIPDGFDAASELKNLLPLLPQWRLQKALSYRQDIDRFLCAKSFLMIEDMLREKFGLSHCPEFSYDSHGKPYFLNYPGIFFNISHCHRGIACAVLDKPVGVDIEEIQFDEDLAKVIFNQKELEAVRSADEPAVKFTDLWTRKESFLKLTGEGLRDNLKDVLSGADKATISTGINRSVGYIHSVAIWEKKIPARLCDEHQKNI